MNLGSDELPRLLAMNLDRYFELLVSNYGIQLYTFALRWTGNSADAEDILQITFERAFLALDDYPPQRIVTLKLRPWLYKIALNVTRNYTSRSHIQVASLELSVDETLAIEDDWRYQPEVVAENAERRREMEGLVATLAPCYRDAITLCYFGDLSYQETATLLNKSVGTIKFYVHRGRELLRKMLETQVNEVR
ncbi:MAG: RNA polymerase sigma factor [Ktedonobacteraceae bacterium]|nr:RNA polymerase sigma factor [Ktedonobacteraceae bacterium]